MTRKKMNNVWTDWYRMDNYGTKNLSELASLLGATVTLPVNLDTYTTSGIYFIGSDLVEVFIVPDDGRVIQRVTQTSGGTNIVQSFVRVGRDGVFGNPKRLDLI